MIEVFSVLDIKLALLTLFLYLNILLRINDSKQFNFEIYLVMWIYSDFF